MMPRFSALAAAVALAAVATPALAGTVEITLTGVRPDAGELYVGLQTEAQFLQSAGVAGTVVHNPQDGTVTVTLTDIDPGTYSFSAWHDIDGDGSFSMANGLPADGWAMAKPVHGMPTFAQESFTVGEGTTRLTAPMHYPEGGQ